MKTTYCMSMTDLPVMLAEWSYRVDKYGSMEVDEEREVNSRPSRIAVESGHSVIRVQRPCFCPHPINTTTCHHEDDNKEIVSRKTRAFY